VVNKFEGRAPVLKAIKAAPLVWLCDSWLVELQAMAGYKDVRLMSYDCRSAVSPFQQADSFWSENTALVMFAVIAISVNHLTVERLLFDAGILASLVTHKRKPTPIGVSRSCFRFRNRLVAITADVHNIVKEISERSQVMEF